MNDRPVGGSKGLLVHNRASFLFQGLPSERQSLGFVVRTDSFLELIGALRACAPILPPSIVGRCPTFVA